MRTTSPFHLAAIGCVMAAVSGRAAPLFIKASWLHGLHRTDDARAASEEAEAILKPRLLDRLADMEGFLDNAGQYDVLLHRGTQALPGAVRAGADGGGKP
jgi:hypothetical protein